MSMEKKNLPESVYSRLKKIALEKTAPCTGLSIMFTGKLYDEFFICITSSGFAI